MSTVRTTPDPRAEARVRGLAVLAALFAAVVATLSPLAVTGTASAAAAISAAGPASAAQGTEREAAPIAQRGPTQCDGTCPPPGNCDGAGCVGKDPEVQDCNGVTVEEKWIPALQATLWIRAAGNCTSRWARLHWIDGNGSMSGVAIQHRRYLNGAWQNGSVQDATRGLNSQTTAYWTPMVYGGGSQYRYRTAEGYFASGCSTNCVRFRWSDWSTWRS